MFNIYINRVIKEAYKRMQERRFWEQSKKLWTRKIQKPKISAEIYINSAKILRQQLKKKLGRRKKGR